MQQLRPGTNWSGEMDTVETMGTIITNNKKQPNPNELPPSCTWLEIVFRSVRRRPSSWHKHLKRPQQEKQPCRLSTTEERARSPGGISVLNHVIGVWENQHWDQLHSNWKTIYTHCKYCLVMDNTQQEGYVTEKILYGLLGG